METIKMVIFTLVGIILFSGIIYGSYWLKKKVSYALFYADSTEDTIRSMVKPECLK